MKVVDRDALKHNILNINKLTQENQKAKQIKKYSIELINESMETNPKNIQPILLPVDSKSEYWKEWKAIEENIASFEFRRSPGRNCYFLIKNKYDNKNLGVLDVAADFLSLGARDKYIGWNKEQQKKYNRNIANISICVPTRHFGYNLCGGKLLALLAISNDVAKHWKDRYGDDLVGLTVTSLYGKSVQYNRLKYFKYLGKTAGQGTCQIPMDLYKECRKLVEEEEGKIPSGRFTTGKNHSMRIIRKACKILNIDASILTTHERKRGVYWCDRGLNTKEFLTEQTSDYKEIDLNTDELIDYWREQWAYRRLHNLSMKNTYEQHIG